MSLQSLWISDYATGLESDKEPWKLLDDAFTTLENFDIYRGQVINRKCPALLGRLILSITGESIGTKAAHYTGNFANTPIVPGSVDFTEDGFLQEVTDDSEGNLIGDVDPTGTNTINYVTGVYDVTFAAPTGNVVVAYDYYPLNPVMGIRNRETTSRNLEETIVFDTTDAYVFNQVTLQFASINTATQTWTGTNLDFFTSENYWINTVTGVKYLWATNGKIYSTGGGDTRDGIKYYDGTTWATLHAIIYNDGADHYLNGAKVIIAFKGHFLCMNTYEDAIQYQNKYRWTAQGNPLDVDAFRHDIIGKGGYLYSTSSEEIINAFILNGRLIVQKERSFVELAYTGNSQLPFIERQITQEFGSESQFSTQIVKDVAFSIAQKAITGCNGNSVERIDVRNPDLVFSINNLLDSEKRVHSVRDYLREFIYWTLPLNNATYPNNLLVFNYLNGAFSLHEDHYTALGTFQKTISYKWSTIGKKWSECGFKWSDAITKAETPVIIGGNQRGFIHILDITTLDDPSLDVSGVTVATNDLTCTAHNLSLNEDYFIVLTNLLGITGYSENKIYKVSPTDANTLHVNTDETWTGTYIGGGSIAILKPFRFMTKKFNPFIEKDRNMLLAYLDLYIDTTNNGKISVNVYGSENTVESVALVEDLSTAIANYDNDNATKLWRRIQVHSQAVNIQIEVGLTEDLLLSDNGLDVYKAGLNINAMRLWVRPCGMNRGLL